MRKANKQTSHAPRQRRARGGEEWEVQWRRGQVEAEALRKERDLLRAAERAGRVGVFSWELESGDVFSTGELEKLLGLERGELGEDFEGWSRLVEPEERVQLERGFEEWLQSGRRAHRWEYRLVRPDGEVRWLEARAELVRDETGRVRRVIGTNVDITERREMEQALRECEEQYRTLLELAPDAMGVHQEGRLVYVNAAAVKLLGARGAEELVGREVWDFVHPEERETTRERARLVLESGELVDRRETRVIRLNGKEVLGETAVRRVSWMGKPAVQVVVRDATARKQAQTGLERLVNERTARVGEVETELEHMSYCIIHELRAPLRAIHGYASLIERADAENLSTESRDMLSRMTASVLHMDRLITDALNYNKAVRSQMSLQEVNVGQVLEQLLRAHSEFQPPRAQVRVEGEIPGVLGNEILLAECFAELLRNGVKFVQPGRMPQIRLWAQSGVRDRGAEGREGPVPQVRIWVEDNGTGIPEQGRERIFSMFQRMHGREYEGTGIGLALVKKLVERMGGQVGVESEVGKGSRFWVELRAAGG